MTKFTDLGLSQPLIDALAAKDYTQPTPIQAQAIPAVLKGRDLVGIAQTGTGKTAAFMLPSLDRLVANSKGKHSGGKARMLVLAPTRELAAQIATSARAYADGQHIRVGVIFGGVPVPRSIREVGRGLDVLVATPGRLLDLVDQGVLDLGSLEILVLDEADQMLDLGFIHDLKRIVKLVPKRRQTLFFSATMPKNIRQLAERYCHDPVEVAVTPVATTAERVEQFVTFVNQAEKAALLVDFYHQTEIDRSLVFSRTKHGADKIVRILAAAGIESNAIHGNKSQAQRERALGLFRSGEVPILVATDIAARGIDIPGVSHVVNYDLPNVPEQYVHRIGRTARAGADGIAIAFCAEDEKPYLRDIERLTREKIAHRPLPANFRDKVEHVAGLKLPPKKSGRSDGGGRDRRERGGYDGPKVEPTDMKADKRGRGRRRKNQNQRRDGQQGQRAEGQGQAQGQGQGRPQRPQGQRPQGQRPQGQRPQGQRPGGNRGPSRGPSRGPGGGQRRSGGGGAPRG